MKQDMKHIVGITTFFILYYVARKLYFSSLVQTFSDWTGIYIFSYGLAYILVGLPFILYAAWHYKMELFKVLGLQKPFWRVTLIALVFTLPMFLGYAWYNALNTEITVKTFFTSTVYAAFFEEFYYRALFFGLLFKQTRLGFFPAVILGALVFASVHLYQSDNPGTMIGIFITTLMGAGWFAWLYSEWDFNLWMPIGMHFFMNLSWMLFAAGVNALGGLEANIFRIMTIAFSVIGTNWYKKKKGHNPTIYKGNIWLKKAA